MSQYSSQLEKVISTKTNLEYHREGVYLHEEREFDRAIDCFYRALAIDKDYYRTHYSLGNSLLEKGEIDTAIFYYGRCIELKPDFFMAYKKMGEALVKLSQIDTALFAYQEAAKHNRKSPKRLTEIVSRSCKNIQEAPDDLQTAIWKANALGLLGWKELAIQHHREAISELNLWQSFDTKNYMFTENVFTSRALLWKKYLSKYINTSNVQALEIGSLQGMSACWLLDNVLTHSSAEITCIDPYFMKLFHQNISATNASNKVTLIEAMSQEAVAKLKDNYYDFVYIDGSHLAPDVLTDAISCWRVTKVNGLMIFDDYLRKPPKNRQATPKIAIDAFLSLFSETIELIHTKYQVIIRKISNSIDYEDMKNMDINLEIESRIRKSN